VAVYFAVMLALGPAVGALLVLGRVLIADVIDEDERRTGLRREAMYFGMQGLMTKVSFGVGPLLATLLFTAFGNTAEQPLGILLCGPLAGVLALVGWLVFGVSPSGSGTTGRHGRDSTATRGRRPPTGRGRGVAPESELEGQQGSCRAKWSGEADSRCAVESASRLSIEPRVIRWIRSEPP
jgi:MFS family permease